MFNSLKSIITFWLYGGRVVRLSVRSHAWRDLRESFIKENNFCAACGTQEKLEVHHIEPVHLNPSRELDKTNLITLCDKYCHFAIGHLMDYKSWNKDVIKDSAIYLDKIKTRPYKKMSLDHNPEYSNIECN